MAFVPPCKALPALSQGALVCFGGNGPAGPKTDLALLDLATMTVSRPETTGTAPK